MKPPIPKLFYQTIGDYLPPGTPLVEPDGDSRTGRIVPEIVFNFGTRKKLLRKLLPVLPNILSAKRSIAAGFRSLKPPAGKLNLGYSPSWKITPEAWAAAALATRGYPGALCFQTERSSPEMPSC